MHLVHWLKTASGVAEYFSTMSGLSLVEQLDFRKTLARNFKKWKSGWKNRLDKDTIVATMSNTGLGRFIGLFQGVLGTDDIAGNEDNLDKLNQDFVRDGRFVNQAQGLTTRIHRWLAKIVVGIAEGKDEIAKKGELDPDLYSERFLEGNVFYGQGENEDGLDASAWASLQAKPDTTEENNK